MTECTRQGLKKMTR
uniref:Uncharacterized protein n=1 Tax=Rhizophora mucronata TaxID=61149 RepID=A0A2P2QWB8_RHIMU